MIEYIFKLPLQGARTSYTNVVLTTNDVLAYRFVFTFIDNGKAYDVSDCSLVVKGKRSDGTILTDGGVVTKDGKAYYDVKSGFYNVEGELLLEVALCTQEGGYITAHELVLNVRAGHGESNLTAQNTTPVLAQLVSRAQAAERAAYQAANVAESAKEEMRQLHANAILGKTESTVVCLEDVSPLAHQVKVMVSSVDDPTAVTVTKCGKSLFDLSDLDLTYTNHYNGFNFRYIDVRNLRGKRLIYQREVDFTNTIEDTATFSIKVIYYDENKNILQQLFAPNITKSSDSKICVMSADVTDDVVYMGFCTMVNFDLANPAQEGSTMRVFNSMVEVSRTKSDYEPYSAETFTPNADGMLYIPSQSPVMTLYSDTAGANIECEYNRDSNKVIEKLTNSIISLGGNV